MKVKYYTNELFIQPETEFEQEVLRGFINCKSYLKSGTDMSDTLGILIRQDCKDHNEKKYYKEPDEQVIHE